MSNANPNDTKPLNFKDSGLRLLRAMGPDRGALIASVGFGAGSVALSVVVPVLIGHIVDLIVAGTAADGVDFAAVARILAGIGGLVIAAALLGYGRGRLAVGVSQRLAFRLRRDATAKLSRVPLSHFDNQPRGEILSKVTNDIDNIANIMQQALTRVIASVLTVVGVLVMMLVVSPLLTGIVLLSVPVAVWVTKTLGKRAQPRFVRQWTATGELNGHIEEMYTGHTLVRVFGQQDNARRVFAERNESVYTASYLAQFISGFIEPAMQFVGNLNYVVIAVVGGLRVASGTMSIGDISAFIGYVMRFNNPVSQTAALANLLQSGVASAERVFGLLDTPEQQPDPQPGATVDQVSGRMEFDSVSFAYNDNEPLIKDLSLIVEPGQTVAIVGPTGAGKTTLVNLLMRFYEVTGGRILLDGVDIATLSREKLRGHIGMVLQDTWLFGGTIADNIGYGVPEATREEIIEAARAVRADHFIRTLPDGYDTVIDDEGANLSAGERQLITIARAFILKSAIMVLDEATSAVDTRTEALIQQAMASLRAGRTSFVIAHRLSTIEDADTILVMEAGSIVEQGNHETLINTGGVYARLYAAQFAGAAVA